MPELRKWLYTTKYQSNIFEPYQSPQPTTKRQASSAPSSQNNRDKENEWIHDGIEFYRYANHAKVGSKTLRRSGMRADHQMGR